MSQQIEYAECQKRLRGFFRARVRNLADADELAQETWLIVLRHEDSYDSERGPLCAFAFSRARYCLLEYYQRTKDRRALESLFCELQSEGEELNDPPERSGISGLGSFARGEESTRQAHLDYLTVVDRLLALPSPPHQIFVFVMVWLLESTPREIDERWSGDPLSRLESYLENECRARWCLSAGEVQRKFRVLRQRLGETLGQIINEPRTRLTYQALLDRIAGDTMLRDYYTGTPRNNIVQWWYSVMRVLVKTIGGPLRSDAPGREERRGR